MGDGLWDSALCEARPCVRGRAVGCAFFLVRELVFRGDDICGFVL